ncbi:MAG TPA: HEPN domain-containing protein [Candidatus Deferrimicrobium sp.]|nr:HEPN domain-containing protein [Candidatus Deferrimicrobium sp.]
MIDEQAQSLSEYRLNKAKNLLNQAELLLTNQRYDGSINRSYYAIFNAIRAVLALVRLDSRSHQGVIAYFDRYFVKPGIFEKQFSKIIHTAFDTRQDNDYEDFYDPSEADAQNQYENARLFIREIENKRESFIEGTISLPVITQ